MLSSFQLVSDALLKKKRKQTSVIYTAMYSQNYFHPHVH